MAGTGVNDHEGSAHRIDFDTVGWDDPDQGIIYRLIQRAAVENEFRLETEYVRSDLSKMLHVLITALSHHVPKQDAALGGIDHVFDSGAEWAKGGSRAAGLVSTGGHGLTFRLRLIFRQRFAAIFRASRLSPMGAY
jgi:hypothetical protein